MAADPAPWWPWVLPAGWVSALLCSGQRCDALAVDDFATGEPIPRWLGRRGRGAGAGRRSVPEHATSQPGQGPTHDPTLLCQDSSIAYQQVTILRAWATAAGYLNGRPRRPRPLPVPLGHRAPAALTAGGTRSRAPTRPVTELESLCCRRRAGRREARSRRQASLSPCAVENRVQAGYGQRLAVVAGIEHPRISVWRCRDVPGRVGRFSGLGADGGPSLSCRRRR